MCCVCVLLFVFAHSKSDKYSLCQVTFSTVLECKPILLFKGATKDLRHSYFVSRIAGSSYFSFSVDSILFIIVLGTIPPPPTPTTHTHSFNKQSKMRAELHCNQFSGFEESLVKLNKKYV